MKKLALPMLMVTVLAFVLPAIAEAKQRGHKTGDGYRGHRKGRVVLYRPFVSFGYASAYWHGRHYGRGYYGPYPHGWDGAGYGTLGKVDLDVKPKKTQVFIDGSYVGTAGKLDGFPDFLWLKQGKYELTLYLPGHETQTRQIAVFPRLLVPIETQMVPGEATPPKKAKSE